jgi:hypothetical protein
MFRWSQLGMAMPFWPPDYPIEVAECAYSRCGNPVYAGDKNWEFYGEWFCSAACIARHLGAKKRYTRNTPNSIEPTGRTD